LEIAVSEAIADPLLEPRHHLVRVHRFHAAAKLPPRHQTEGHARDDAKQAVTADRGAEQLRVFVTGAANCRSVGA